MTRTTRVVVGTDGSPTAERAIEVGATVALATDVPLVVVTSWQRSTHDDRSALEAAGGPERIESAHWAQETVADGAAVGRRAGVEDVRTLIPVGEPGIALENLAAEQPGTLLVVGTLGLTAASERLLGNIPHHLTHHAPGDLLLVKTDAADHDWRTIALATDGSDTAERACRAGLDLARRLDATPVLVSAGSDDGKVDEVLDRVAEAIDDGGPLELESVVGDDVPKDLISVAADHGLFVLGNRRMHGMARLLGSVPNDLTHNVPTDLLLVDTSR